MGGDVLRRRAPSAKKVCDSQTHTDTTEHNTHCHSDSNTPQAQRSVARTVCCLSDCPQLCLKFEDENNDGFL